MAQEATAVPHDNVLLEIRGLKMYFPVTTGVIVQDPYSSLNPRMSAGSIIGEPIIVHGLVSSRAEYREKVAELLNTVGLNPYMADRFPHEFSGGSAKGSG